MTYVNYDDVLSQILGAGIILKPEDLLIGTPRPVRRAVEGDREKRGWYRLYELALKSGDRLIIGSYGIWHGDDAGATKITLPKTSRQALDPDQQAAIKSRQTADRKRAESERAAEIDRAAVRATKWWSMCREDGQASYLTSKALPAGRLYGARLSPDGNLVIPIQDGDARIYGLQVIYQNAKAIKKKGRNKDYAPPGLAKQGHWHQIGSPAAGGIILLCEGFATGASLHEATTLPVAIAFDAGNLLPVAQALRKRYRNACILVCADDDYLGPANGKENTGVIRAQAAALAVDGGWAQPIFPTERPTDKKGPTDFNDLHTHPDGGLRMVAAQIEAAISAMGWRSGAPARGDCEQEGGGEQRNRAVSIMPLDEAMQRFLSIDDDTGDFVFDTWTHQVCRFGKILRMLPARVRTDDIKDHPTWRSRAVYIDQIGFDPGGEDPNIICNRWTGWPTKPVQGSCDILLDLLRYLCSGEGPQTESIYQWLLKWLAYPIQHPGAKMHSAIVVHGPQGTGKSRFFEAYAKIYGDYSIVLNQGAIEDKFNADWCERKLFVLADEIVARADMYHLKNQLKNFITGEWVRVNPKNVAAHRERNHMNIAFLSNEKQPVVLENDDRRHLVLWTPEKLSEDFYDEVNAEIDAGGIAALHHYLLTLDLGEFRPWTKPPMTTAKRSLIDISLSSDERFIADWLAGDVVLSEDWGPLPVCPAGSDDFYAAYLRYCRRQGEARPRPQNQFMGTVTKRPGWEKTYKDRYESCHCSGKTKRQRMIIPSPADMQAAGSEHAQTPGQTMAVWITHCFFAFRSAMGADQ